MTPIKTHFIRTEGIFKKHFEIKDLDINKHH